MDNEPQFRFGEHVEEAGGDIEGTIVASGDYPGEWRIRTPAGNEIACLGINLARTGRWLDRPRR